jgi:hypothetical protein
MYRLPADIGIQRTSSDARRAASSPPARDGHEGVGKSYGLCDKDDMGISQQIHLRTSTGCHLRG